MAQTPSCCDGPNDLLRKILLQFLSLATNPPANLQPSSGDGPTDFYRKILLTLNYI